MERTKNGYLSLVESLQLSCGKNTNWRDRIKRYHHISDSQIKDELYMFILLKNGSMVYPYGDFDNDIAAALAEVYYTEGRDALWTVIDRIVCYNQPNYDKERYFEKILEVIKRDYKNNI